MRKKLSLTHHNPCIIKESDITFESGELVEVKNPVIHSDCINKTPTQGSMGNCWLVSMIRALSINHPTIYKEIVTKVGDDHYAVVLHDGCKKIKFELSSTIPKWTKAAEIHANKSDIDIDITTALIEKAALILEKKGYLKLNGYYPSVAQELLTGHYGLTLQLAAVEMSDLIAFAKINKPMIAIGSTARRHAFMLHFKDEKLELNDPNLSDPETVASNKYISSLNPTNTIVIADKSGDLKAHCDAVKTSSSEQLSKDKWLSANNRHRFDRLFLCPDFTIKYNKIGLTTNKPIEYTVTYENGMVYTGEGEHVDALKTFVPHGNGVLTLMGHVYEGEFNEGAFNGKGQWKTIHENNEKLLFKGTWINNKPDKGIHYNYWDSGELKYMGEKNNFMTYHGKGLFITATGKKYDGYFENGKLHGVGTLFDSNGKIRFKGEFKNGEKDGAGTLFDSDGKIHFKGKFKNGKRDGAGTLFDPDGAIRFTGDFIDGKPIE